MYISDGSLVHSKHAYKKVNGASLTNQDET